MNTHLKMLVWTHVSFFLHKWFSKLAGLVWTQIVRERTYTPVCIHTACIIRRTHTQTHTCTEGLRFPQFMQSKHIFLSCMYLRSGSGGKQKYLFASEEEDKHLFCVYVTEKKSQITKAVKNRDEQNKIMEIRRKK